jgi:adenosylcobinamide-phosphate guanylyltransferase
MIGLVMAGGKGSRMDKPGEKLLLYHKKPLVLHVVDALVNSNCFSRIVAATSSNSPNTEKLLLENQIQTLHTKGADYVEDLTFALSNFEEPVFVVSGDLPLLDHTIIQDMVSKHQKTSSWQSFVVSKKFLEQQNLNLEYSVLVNDTECYYTGISIVNPKSGTTNETHTILDDKRITVNLNTRKDYDLLKNS